MVIMVIMVHKCRPGRIQWRRQERLLGEFGDQDDHQEDAFGDIDDDQYLVRCGWIRR